MHSMVTTRCFPGRFQIIIIFIKKFLALFNPGAKLFIRNIFKLLYNINIIRFKRKFIYKRGFRVLNKNIYNKKYIINYYVIFLNF
jgi:hypothetical protein